ncbi:MAG: hypothetical protein MUF37_01100 [Methanoregulaceae archaeon]|nr:hypothetical protein [Methanoregulaceae archaeon]
MKPDDILAENPESRVIPLHDLVSFTVTKKILQSAEEGDQVFWEVKLLTKSGTISLRTDYDQDPREYIARPALLHLLGERLVSTNM